MKLRKWVILSFLVFLPILSCSDELLNSINSVTKDKNNRTISSISSSAINTPIPVQTSNIISYQTTVTSSFSPQVLPSFSNTSGIWEVSNSNEKFYLGIEIK